jgi:AcrR family transcriptional regulator
VVSKGLESGSKGSRTQAEILEHAVKIAASEGLSGLTIGRLAEELKMSKSGLFAHFRAKQKLELATIEHAWEIFSGQVLLPAEQSREGIDRVWALCDSWLRHIEGRVFRGSYFFTGAFFQHTGRQGQVPSRVAEAVRQWFEVVKDSVRAAQKRGEIENGVNPRQISFELQGLMIGAYWNRLLGHDEAFEKARTAVLRQLAAVASEDLPSTAFASLSDWRKFLRKRDR